MDAKKSGSESRGISIPMVIHALERPLSGGARNTAPCAHMSPPESLRRGSALGAVRHAEISPQLLDCRHPRGDGHLLGDRGERVVQAPRVPWPELVYERLEVEPRRRLQVADRQDPLDEDVVQDRLRLAV